MADDINKMLEEDFEYGEIQQAITDTDPNYPVPHKTSLSRHYKNHFLPKNVKHLIWKNGRLCFADGTPLTQVSVTQFLESIINLGVRNLMDNPKRVGPRDALLAAELMLKIRSGIDKLDDFEQAWTDYIRTGKTRSRRKKRVTVEVTEESTEAMDDAELSEEEYTDAEYSEVPQLPEPNDELKIEYDWGQEEEIEHV